MTTLTIDGREVTVDNGMTVLQACESIGIEIPRFCYHERLSIAGNCRMCLVDMDRSPKPIASCAMPAAEGMVITTNSPAVRKMRRSVMEFLLINHPLDCPICDQGGECDLQDQAMAYGSDQGRYKENKRSVEDKYMGPLIKTVMTRCIHCTRCIRFAEEVAGVTELGTTGRGEHMEVGTYVEKALSSELSGNLVDLCPVGALTSAPYAFTARSWELRKVESIDVMDAMGAAIRVDARGMEVMRILPLLNEDINEEWISDKSRHACDGLTKRRLDKPWVRDETGRLQPATWADAFAAIRARLDGLAGHKLAAIAGDMADVEAMTALKDLMQALKSPHLDCRQNGAALSPDCRASYLFNSTIAGIDEADLCLLIGTNPRLEAPVLNARIRRGWLQRDMPVGVIGPADMSLTYAYDHLGIGPAHIAKLMKGRTGFVKLLKQSKRPMFIIGQGVLTRPDSAAILHAIRTLAEHHGVIGEEWNGYNILHTAAGRVGGMDIGFIPQSDGLHTRGIVDGVKTGAIDTVFLLGADAVDIPTAPDGASAFVIYQGHHGDKGAHRANVILPGAAYTEKNATYVNMEGRVQHTRPAVAPPGDAREDWSIIRALSDVLGVSLKYDTLAQVRARMAKLSPVFADAFSGVPLRAAPWGPFGTTDLAIGKEPFTLPIDNFYQTDPISRASATMQACADALGKPQAKSATHG